MRLYKDVSEVSEIKPIIGITGKKGSGKDTATAMIQFLQFQSNNPGVYPDYENYKAWVKDFGHFETSSIENRKFADKVKEVASIMLGVPVEWFEDQNFKNEQLGPEWDYMTVREFIQKLGTDAVRFGLHKNTWINTLFQDYQLRDHSYFDIRYWPRWIISDVRFLNEAGAIRERGGKIIKLLRNYDSLDSHQSETEIEEIPGDVVVNNRDYSPQQLFNLVRKFFQEYDLYNFFKINEYEGANA